MAARHMTTSARDERFRLRDSCAPAFAELRRLARKHFANCPAIPSAIEDLERSLAALAALAGVPEQGPSAEHKCPACGAVLERLDKYGFLAPDNPTNIYCSPCLKIIMPSLSVLRSLEEGFGTDAI